MSEATRKERTDAARRKAARASHHQPRPALHRTPHEAPQGAPQVRPAIPQQGDDDDADPIDRASRDAMPAGDPPAFAGGPTLSRGNRH